MKNLIYFSILITLFLGQNVLHYVGWRIGESNANAIQKIAPQLYILVFVLIYTFNKNKIYDIRAIRVFMILLLLSVFKIITNDVGQLSNIPNSLLMPVIIYLCMSTVPDLKINIVRKSLIYFFIIESLIAIYEKIFSINLFKFTGEKNLDSYIEQAFRSTALQNHPLNNALCISIMMSFILVDSKMKAFHKLILMCLGFISLLCFNTRSSIVLWAIIFVIYFIKIVFFSRDISSINKIAISFTYIICLVISILLIFNFGWGDRLIEIDIKTDGSTQARFDVWKIFDYYKIEDFLWGGGATDFASLMKFMDFEHLENFWIAFLIRYGLIFTFLITFYYVLFINKVFNKYSTFSKYIILGSFAVLSSTNNSLATNDPVLSFLIVGAYAFAPILIKVPQIKTRVYTEVLI